MADNQRASLSPEDIDLITAKVNVLTQLVGLYAADGLQGGQMSGARSTVRNSIITLANDIDGDIQNPSPPPPQRKGRGA